MTVKEAIALALDELSDEESRQVAEYIAFLRFRSRVRSIGSLSTKELARLYGEFADEDRELAEMGMRDFSQQLSEEDQ